MKTNASMTLVTPSFIEGFVGLSYTFSATFILSGVDLTPQRIRDDFELLYETTRMHRVRKLPRVIARYILVPVYCASSFEKTTVEFMYGYSRPSQWRVLMKPVLYNAESNAVEANDAIQNSTINYYHWLSELFTSGVSKAAVHFGHNPKLTKNEPTRQLIAGDVPA